MLRDAEAGMNNPVLPGEAVSVLTDEQKQWFLDRFGVRYVGVQANPGVMSRKARRQAGDRGHNFGRHGRMDVPKR